MVEDQRPPAHQQTGNQSEFLRSLMRALPGLTSEVRQNLEQLKADEERKKKVLEASWLTYVIGDREHAPSRVAFIVIVLAMLLLLPTFYLIIIGKDQSPLLDKIVTGIFSLASGALGFLFGQYMADRTRIKLSLDRRDDDARSRDRRGNRNCLFRRRAFPWQLTPNLSPVFEHIDGSASDAMCQIRTFGTI